MYLSEKKIIERTERTERSKEKPANLTIGRFEITVHMRCVINAYCNIMLCLRLFKSFSENLLLPL